MHLSEQVALNLLQPKVRELAKKLKGLCAQEGVYIQIVRGYRTITEQEELYKRGRVDKRRIVTRRRGGYSFHNFGVAFDIYPLVPLKNEKMMKSWYKKAGRLGTNLGLEWGGSWENFVDMPHFHYTAGYTIENFRKNNVDWQDFE
jgi:peptidoglycan L-alanyl-D-glutamate endopeptidase CwlK